MYDNDMNVEHGALDMLSGDLAAGAGKIQRGLDTMDAELKHLQTDWDGQAKLAYDAAKKEWTSAMDALRQVLVQISEGVSTANHNYRTTDQRSASAF